MGGGVRNGGGGAFSRGVRLLGIIRYVLKISQIDRFGWKVRAFYSFGASIMLIYVFMQIRLSCGLQIQ